MKTLWSLLILSTVSPLAVAADSAPMTKTRAKLAGQKPVNIVCLGDSVTGIYYHTGGRRAYPEMVAIGLQQIDPQAKVTVINAGISGNTTSDGLNRLDKDVLSHRPDLVTVMFGLNDMARGSKESYQANLKTIVERCRAAGAEVLLCTPNGIIDNPGRTIAKLVEFNDAMKTVGRETQTPVCDVYAAYESVKTANPLAFRLLCSDEIHPNMDGHKLNAETICQAITGKTVSLRSVGPPLPATPKTLKLLAEKQPIRVVAMTPFDQWIGPALTQLDPAAQVEIIPLKTSDQTLAQLHEAAQKIRDQRPDLVLVAVPLDVTPAFSNPQESAIHDHSWILNNALSFGRQEWDVIGIAPSVLKPPLSDADRDRESFSQAMLRAQDLSFIQRQEKNTAEPAVILAAWLKSQRP
ncbi:MAG: SGNH/GDSL hydrolase family protein [Planctomycetaceae bacterium]